MSAAVLTVDSTFLLALAGFMVLGLLFGKLLPTSFLPDEDQGYVLIAVQLPDGQTIYS